MPKEKNEMSKYISAWTIHTGSLRSEIASALEQGEVAASDIVWRGPSGDAIIAASPADLDEEYTEYTDSGMVSEYLDD